MCVFFFLNLKGGEGGTFYDPKQSLQFFCIPNGIFQSVNLIYISMKNTMKNSKMRGDRGGPYPLLEASYARCITFFQT